MDDSELVETMHGVREYGSGPAGAVDEGFEVQLRRMPDSGRLVVRAYNEAGYSGTEIDLEDLIAWLRANGRV